MRLLLISSFILSFCLSFSLQGDEAGKQAIQQALATMEAGLGEQPPVCIERPAFRAGWGRCSIVPQKPGGLFGYENRRGALRKGVADEIQVKALALENVETTLVVFTADLLLTSDNVTRAVRQALGKSHHLPGEAIFFSATHTHSAPNPWDSPAGSLLAGGVFVPEYGERLVKAYTDAATTALDQLAPARFGSGRVAAEDLTRNRARKGFPYDSAAEFLLVESRGKRCLLANVSGHGTILGSGNLLVSGDWLGWLQRHLEDLGFAQAMVQSGAPGSVSPVSPRLEDRHFLRVWKQIPPQEGLVPPTRVTTESRKQWRSFAKACALGEILAKRLATGAAETELQGPLCLASTSSTCRLPPPRIVLGGGNPLPPLMVPMLGISPDEHFQSLRIGKIILCGIGGEFSGELSLPLKMDFANRGIHLWISSFSTGYKGYISPDRYYMGAETPPETTGTGRYETRDMAWFGPNAGEYFSTLISRQANALCQGEDKK